MAHIKYKINQVAKMHNISKKTLIHYQRIGIFKPQYIDEKNNYRYYDIKEFPVLKQIIYLKKMGFSLREIKNLLENRENDYMIEKLSLKNMEISSKIQELQVLKSSIENSIETYKKAKYIDSKDLYKPSTRIFNERKACYFKCDEESSREEIMLTYRKVLKFLQDSNIFSNEGYGTIYLKEGIKSGFRHNAGAFIRIPRDVNIENQIVLEEGRYICMYKNGGYYNEDAVQYFLKWIKDNGYTPLGHIYEYSLIDYTFTKSIDNMIAELQVRVE